MNSNDLRMLSEAYSSIYQPKSNELVEEQYHIHDLPIDQQSSVNTLIDNGFKVVGYATKSGQRILTLRKLGQNAIVDGEGFVNDEDVDTFLANFKAEPNQQTGVQGFTNRDFERDLAASRQQRELEGRQEREWETGALHGADAYNDAAAERLGESTLNESLSPEFIEKIKTFVAQKGTRKAAYALINSQVKKHTMGIGLGDLADTATVANALDEISDALDSEDYEGAYENAKQAAIDVLEDEGFGSDLFESTLNEAKKKTVSAKKNVNPWAVEKALEKKTGKHFSKEKKEKIVQGIKKGAEKYGKKITSKKVKK